MRVIAASVSSRAEISLAASAATNSRADLYSHSKFSMCTTISTAAKYELGENVVAQVGYHRD